MVSATAAVLDGVRVKLPPWSVTGRPPSRLLVLVPLLSMVRTPLGFTVAAIVFPPASVPAPFRLRVPWKTVKALVKTIEFAVVMFRVPVPHFSMLKYWLAVVVAAVALLLRLIVPAPVNTSARAEVVVLLIVPLMLRVAPASAPIAESVSIRTTPVVVLVVPASACSWPPKLMPPLATLVAEVLMFSAFETLTPLSWMAAPIWPATVMEPVPSALALLSLTAPAFTVIEPAKFWLPVMSRMPFSCFTKPVAFTRVFVPLMVRVLPSDTSRMLLAAVALLKLIVRPVLKLPVARSVEVPVVALIVTWLAALPSWLLALTESTPCPIVSVPVRVALLSALRTNVPAPALVNPAEPVSAPLRYKPWVTLDAVAVPPTLNVAPELSVSAWEICNP